MINLRVLVLFSQVTQPRQVLQFILQTDHDLQIDRLEAEEGELVAEADFVVASLAGVQLVISPGLFVVGQHSVATRTDEEEVDVSLSQLAAPSV